MPVSVRPARSVAPHAPRNAQRVVLVKLALVGERRGVRVHGREQLQRLARQGRATAERARLSVQRHVNELLGAIVTALAALAVLGRDKYRHP